VIPPTLVPILSDRRSLIKTHSRTPIIGGIHLGRTPPRRSRQRMRQGAPSTRQRSRC